MERDGFSRANEAVSRSSRELRVADRTAREVLEARELADEREPDDAGRAVALLGDDQFRDALRIGSAAGSCRRTCPRGR